MLLDRFDLHSPFDWEVGVNIDHHYFHSSIIIKVALVFTLRVVIGIFNLKLISLLASCPVLPCFQCGLM